MPARKRRRKRTPKTTIFGALGLEVATLLAIVAVAQPTVISSLADIWLSRVHSKPSQNLPASHLPASPFNDQHLETDSTGEESSLEHHIARFHHDFGTTAGPAYR